MEKTDVNFRKKLQKTTLGSTSSIINTCSIIPSMAVVSRVKCFFAQTIAAYGKVMLENDPDWQVISKRMMRDMKFFNVEICNLTTDVEPRDVESVSGCATTLNKDPSSDLLCQVKSSPSPTHSFNVAWEEVSSLHFDIDEFEAEIQSHSSPIKGLDDDSEYGTQDDVPKKLVTRNERIKAKKIKKGRREVISATSIDFTIGQTRWEERYRVQDQYVCHIIQKVVRDECAIEYQGVFYKCVKNWVGQIQKGLVVNSNGEFFVHSSEKGSYKKTVSQKDRFLYHDSLRINAPRLVYSTFVKNHPGLNGFAEGDYKIIHLNGQWYDLSIDNLELKRLRRAN